MKIAIEDRYQGLKQQFVFDRWLRSEKSIFTFRNSKKNIS